MNKRGVSPVIATVLILLITIVAAGLLAPFVINFINNNLDDSEACFEVLGDLNFAETEYNCYADSEEDFTSFSVTISDEKILGFSIALTSGGNADTIEITEGATFENVRMLNNAGTAGEFNQPLSIPQNGGTRTYVVKGLYEKLEIFPLLESDKSCSSSSDSIEPDQCSTEISAELGQ